MAMLSHHLRRGLPPPLALPPPHLPTRELFLVALSHVPTHLRTLPSLAASADRRPLRISCRREFSTTSSELGPGKVASFVPQTPAAVGSSFYAGEGVSWRSLGISESVSRSLCNVEIERPSLVQAEFASSAVDFLHRVGRTARAGQYGLVTSLYTKFNKDLVSAVRQAEKMGCPVGKAFSRKRSFRNKLKKEGLSLSDSPVVQTVAA